MVDQSYAFLVCFCLRSITPVYFGAFFDRGRCVLCFLVRLVSLHGGAIIFSMPAVTGPLEGTVKGATPKKKRGNEQLGKTRLTDSSRFKLVRPLEVAP